MIKYTFQSFNAKEGDTYFVCQKQIILALLFNYEIMDVMIIGGRSSVLKFQKSNKIFTFTIQVCLEKCTREITHALK